jgi:hypothetical protein
MADRPQSHRERSDAKKAVRQEEMEDDIAKGRLVVRQMTEQERDESDARAAAASKRRGAQQAAKARAAARTGRRHA